MSDPLAQLAAFHSLLGQRLRTPSDLTQAAQLARSLAQSDMDGGGAFLLFALYFENLARLRAGATAGAAGHENAMAVIIRLIQECLEAIESYDPARLHGALDSFAKAALRLHLP